MEDKGIVGCLMDLSFTSFVTSRVVPIVYIIAIVAAGLSAIGMIITGFRSSPGIGVVTLLLSPIAFAIYVLLARIWLEMVIAIIRVAENTGRMADRAEGKA